MTAFVWAHFWAYLFYWIDLSVLFSNSSVVFLVVLFETRFNYTVQAGLALAAVPLPQPPKCCNTSVFNGCIFVVLEARQCQPFDFVLFQYYSGYSGLLPLTNFRINLLRYIK